MKPPTIPRTETLPPAGADQPGHPAVEPTAAPTATGALPDPPTSTTTGDGGGHGRPRPTVVSALAERFDDLGLIGLGGMGEVRRVRDRQLDRVLALKIMRADRVESPEARARFLDEARVNAGLQHPGIVPVHEQGCLPDGRPWFTMKEIRGRTLDEALVDLPPSPDPLALRRIVSIFVQLSRAVAYAHAQGVVHRDLKPHNVMLGEFGEVLVLDWGIARVARASAPPVEAPAGVPRAPLTPAPAPAGDSRPETRVGRVLGTPAYMSPEQARGENDRVGPPSDAYAIGAMLYRLLVGRPPYLGSALAILEAVRRGPPQPVVDARPPTMGAAPRELVELCAAAMNRALGARPSARAIADQLEGWLDGARKRSRALAVVAEADAMAPEIERLRADGERRRADARELLGALPPHASADAKRAGWQLEDTAEARAREARLIEVRMLQTLRSALNIEPELPEAHQRLAEHYQARLTDAERAGDATEAAIYEELVRGHDRGALADWLRGDGAVSLVTDPPGARVTHLRFERHDRRLIEVEVGVIGHTPLRAVPLPRGSHLLLIEAEGCHPVRYPVQIDREGHWDGIPPGCADAQVIALPRRGTLTRDERYVPAGWAVVGGDPAAPESLPRLEVWVDGFIVRRHPVTNGAYLRFLDIQARAGVDVTPWHPAEEIGGGQLRSLVRQTEGGLDWLPVDGAGRHWQARWPVVQVDHASATAFARALSAETGEPWRLPHAHEWAKAARGVDGRPLPWGRFFEPTWANLSEGTPQRPDIGPVGSHPVDTSPYGISDLVGNVREWCLNPFQKDWAPRRRLSPAQLEPKPIDPATLVEVRGGSFTSRGHLARLATRFAASARTRVSTLGFRVARSWPG